MINKSPDELSRDYYQFVSEFTQTEFEDEKILGKFYTDIDITQNMIQLLTANYAVNRFNSAIRIIDPFCGDGRLKFSNLLYIFWPALIDIICSIISCTIWEYGSCS